MVIWQCCGNLFFSDWFPMDEKIMRAPAGLLNQLSINLLSPSPRLQLGILFDTAQSRISMLLLEWGPCWMQSLPTGQCLSQVSALSWIQESAWCPWLGLSSSLAGCWDGPWLARSCPAILGVLCIPVELPTSAVSQQFKCKNLLEETRNTSISQ